MSNLVPYFAPLRKPCGKNISLAAEFQPGGHHIICGRGKQAYNSIGNRRYRLLIALHMSRYLEAHTKLDKSLVVISIVDAIRTCNGGFVKRCNKTKRWIEIGDQSAREKVGHALRDAITARETEGFDPRTMIAREAVTLQELLGMDGNALELLERHIKSGAASKPVKFQYPTSSTCMSEGWEGTPTEETAAGEGTAEQQLQMLRDGSSAIRNEPFKNNSSCSLLSPEEQHSTGNQKSRRNNKRRPTASGVASSAPRQGKRTKRTLLFSGFPVNRLDNSKPQESVHYQQQQQQKQQQQERITRTKAHSEERGDDHQPIVVHDNNQEDEDDYTPIRVVLSNDTVPMGNDFHNVPTTNNNKDTVGTSKSGVQTLQEDGSFQTLLEETWLLDDQFLQQMGSSNGIHKQSRGAVTNALTTVAASTSHDYQQEREQNMEPLPISLMAMRNRQEDGMHSNNVKNMGNNNNHNIAWNSQMQPSLATFVSL